MSHARNPTERIELAQNTGWAVLAMHEATEAYLIWLFEDTICAPYMPSMLPL